MRSRAFTEEEGTSGGCGPYQRGEAASPACTGRQETTLTCRRNGGSRLADTPPQPLLQPRQVLEKHPPETTKATAS